MAEYDALQRAYRATDGWVHLTVQNDEEWLRLRDTLGEAALADHQWDHHERHPADGEAYLPEYQLRISDDPRFATAEARQRNAEALSSVLTSAFRVRTQQEWADLFEARNVPYRIVSAAR